MTTEILKVLIGSQAHGLARPDSDFDYRGVFVVPTQDILKLGGNPKTTNWNEGKDDETSWEIGHFLFLATKCNPTILEVFGAPVIDGNGEGTNLRAQLPNVLNSKRIFDAFGGYSSNQWRKVFSDKYSNERGRQTKYAMAAVRVLMQGQHLFNTGEMIVDFRTEPNYYGELVTFRAKLEANEYTNGQILDKIERWRTGMFDAMTQRDNRREAFEQDLDAVNRFLLRVRADHWDIQ